MLNGVNPVYYEGGSNGLFVGGAHLLPGQTSDIVDPYATAGRAAAAYQNSADSAASGAVGSAQGGVNAANAAAANAQASITNMNQYAGQAAQSAAGIGTAITNVNNAAGQVNQSAAALTPYASQLNGYGQQVYNQGLGLYNYGQQYLTGSSDILGLNANAGGLTGQYINALMSIDPNRYVSAAASDVNSSYGNARGQMERELARSGVSGGGRSAALNQQWAQAMAAALAGAKTRARQTGNNERLTALGSGLTAAQGMAGTGGTLSAQGVQAQATGGGLVNQAAGVVANQGTLYGQAGSLYGTAGSLGGTQANAYTNAGQLTQGAGQLGISAAGLQVNAASALASAQQTAAQYYAQVSQGWGQLAGTGGLVNAIFG